MDPAPATTFAHLDATIVLERSIAELGIYPAVDPLASTSRALAPEIVGKEHYEVARGVQQVLQRFSGIQSLEVSAGKRASMRADTWRLFLDHPAIGTGLGTFEMVFPRYDSLYDGKVVNHAHNDYLEGLAET